MVALLIRFLPCGKLLEALASLCAFAASAERLQLQLHGLDGQVELHSGRGER